ncbi:hypothetical protein CKM354_000632900 [Cercospora kikuchii]|uniref:Uncharacterized protein n=1 Tax=Cercospora kikuchii TaxID=84275 RepID=A0A9P3CHY2_9PEZI|nr:uncharacterized protein CKM354_000632900 [Cercospora kikuchii]GIZ43088.1 hypothetical protein CKM354_000632900 [Cercospora kikuchii]
MFTCIAKCICRCRKSRTGYATTTIYAEKGHGHFRDEPTKNCADTINEVLGVLLTATAAPDNATRALEEIVRDSGWWDAWTAKALLSAIEDLLRSGKEMASTMEAAVDRAVCEAAKIPELAKQFAEEHPLMVGIVCAIVALGVLYIFWPAVLELLGFGSDGPIEEHVFRGQPRRGGFAEIEPYGRDDEAQRLPTTTVTSYMAYTTAQVCDVPRL